jgi:adenosylmethionine---8-amino-7-oxononanoate aminotransferase
LTDAVTGPLDPLEPPRRCPSCDRRMVVQIMPTGWTATCSRHGVLGPAAAPEPAPASALRPAPDGALRPAPDGALRPAPDGALRPSPEQELLDLDRRHVWHPYASITRPSPTRLVRSASGVRLRVRDHDGREVEAVDAMSSWWSAVHGYRHPRLDAAAHAQIDRMSHVMFGGLTHEPAVRLVEQLVATTPDRLQHVFLADSGSVSVEVGIKMCLQHQRGRGRPGRRRLLTVRGGYHGDTFAAMSVCDPVNGMHSMFTGTLAEQVFAPRPPAGFDRPDDDPAVLAWAGQVHETAARHRDELAAVIVEPVLQGAGGMHVYSPACLRVLREVADQHDLLLVHDEIATGFGRTGAWWAGDHAQVVPDVLCLGKALTGGYLGLAAVLCTAEVAEGVDAAGSGALAHGPTYMGNPLACAVAGASLDLLATGAWRRQVAGISGLLAEGLAPCREMPGVRDVRVLGAVGVVQTNEPVDVAAATAAALAAGVWVRPFRDLIYTMPPYVCTDDDVRAITAAMLAAVRAGVRTRGGGARGGGARRE